MGILSGLAKRAKWFLGSHPRDPALAHLFGASDNASGVHVTEESALTFASVWCAVRVISEAIASLPLLLYRVTDGGRERETGHPVARLVHRRPNQWQTAYQFFMALFRDVLTWGNGYALVVRDVLGRVAELHYLKADCTKVQYTRDGVLTYDYTDRDGVTRTYKAEQIIHFRGLSSDGLVGYSPIRMARESIGLGIASERFAGALFGNDCVPGAVITHPGLIDNEKIQEFRKSIEQQYRGIDKARRLLVLPGDEGVKWERTTIPPEDAQFLESRQFSVIEIARWFRVPPHLLYDLSRATFSNIEHQSIEFVTHSLRPWMVMAEQELNAKLFVTDVEAERFYLEFEPAALLRGDMKSQAESFQIATMNGWLQINEVRAMLNRNGIGPEGDVSRVPVNIQPAGMKAEPAAEPEPNLADNRSWTFGLAAMRHIVERSATKWQRVMAAKIPADRMTDWLANETRNHREYMRRMLMDLAAPVLGKDADGYADHTAVRWMEAFAEDADHEIDPVAEVRALATIMETTRCRRNANGKATAPV